MLLRFIIIGTVISIIIDDVMINFVLCLPKTNKANNLPALADETCVSVSG